jgi:hypothetical protein
MQTLIKKVLGLAALFVAAIRSELGQIGGAGISIPRSALVKMLGSPIDWATTAVNSASLDTQKCRHVDIFILVGAITGTIDAKLQDSADDSSFADLSPAVAITQLAATGDDQLAVLSAKEGSHRRFVRAVVTPTGGSTNLGGILGIGYPVLGEAPPTQETTTAEIVEG